MDDELFARGHFSPLEGGPKGVDVDLEGRVLIVSALFLPVALFDLQAILGATTRPTPNPASLVEDELDRLRELDAAEPNVPVPTYSWTYLRNGLSYRVKRAMQKVVNRSG
jgi:hypothetical protein